MLISESFTVMAKKKQKFKLNKKQRKQALAIGVPLFAAIAGLVVGITGVMRLAE